MKYIVSRPIDFTDPDIGRSSSGHKFHNWITGLYLSKLYDLEYIYSPFTEDAERYESFLNLHTGYKKLSDIQFDKVYPISLNFCHDETLPQTIYYESLERFGNFVSTLPHGAVIDLGHNPFPGMLTQHYEKVIPELQKAYWSLTRRISLFFNENKKNVAIHIRRGDISLNNNPDRWLDLTHYRNIIWNLNRELGKNTIEIYVFSEGRPEEFEDLAADNVNLVLGGSDLAALHHMCSADILVTGQSSFSIMAAYFNKGTTIYTPLKNFMYGWNNDNVMPYDKVDYIKLKQNLFKNG